MRGNITRAILRNIEEITIDMIDLFEVYLEAGYGASSGKIQYLSEKKEREKIVRRRKREEWTRYRKFMYYLEQDGLLKKEISNNKIGYVLTKKGREKVKNESFQIISSS